MSKYRRRAGIAIRDMQTIAVHTIHTDVRRTVRMGLIRCSSPIRHPTHLHFARIAGWGWFNRQS